MRSERDCHSLGDAAAPVRPLRTLIVNAGGSIGPSESGLLAVLDSSERLRVEALLLADGSLRAALAERGIPVTVYEAGAGSVQAVRAAGWLVRELRRRDPDIAVGNGPQARAVLACAAMVAGVPTTWFVGDPIDGPAGARRFTAALAEAARRPGAGLRTGSALSVVSPVLNEAACIDRLVGSIAAQLGPDDEYLLVDSGSTDGTVELIAAQAARDPRIRLLHAPGGCTIGASRNVGVRAARHAFVACTDAGCDPSPNWLDGFRAAAEEIALADRDNSPGAQSTAPAAYLGVYDVGTRPGRLFQQAMAAASWPDPVELRRRTPLRRAYAKLFGRAFSVRRVDGRSLGFRRDIWAAAGGFPEHLRTAEDEAFGRAVVATGARVVLTLDAAVTWHQRPTAVAAFNQFRGYGRGGGASRSRLLIGRESIRIAAYAGAVVAVAVGGVVGLAIVAVGAATYLSVPACRVVRRGQSPLILALLPAALFLKDIAKVVGTVEGLAGVGRDEALPGSPG